MAEDSKQSVGGKIIRNVKKNVQLVTGIKPSAPTRENRIKLLVSIINCGDEHRLKGILDENSVSLSFMFAGTGTARSAVLDYLGIGETEKNVLFSLVPESDEEAIMKELRAQLSLYLAGRGISFTIPLSSISEIIAGGIASAAKEKSVDGRKIMKNENRKYDLIIAAMAPNHVDEAMTAARIAGAAGGTIIRARSIGNEKAEQFVGISLTQEQELLLILAKREGKAAIMQALNEKIGLKTEARGVLFSLPVDRTAGVYVSEEEEEDKKQEE